MKRRGTGFFLMRTVPLQPDEESLPEGSEDVKRVASGRSDHGGDAKISKPSTMLVTLGLPSTDCVTPT